MKHTKYIVILCALLCALVSPSTAHAWPAQVLSVHDGDTITVLRVRENQKPPKNPKSKIKVRLYGIDAPELKQSSGKDSALWLQKRLPAGTEVDVKQVTRDRYKRTVGIVSVTERDDENMENTENSTNNTINAELVQNGQVWVYSQFCKRKECREWERQEREAREARLGLWERSGQDGEAVAPWVWRKAKK